MKRTPILLLLLAFGVAACGGDQTADQTDAAAATPTPTAEATEEPTEEPTDEPSASADAGGESALAELIPDELNGVPGTPIPGMDEFMAGMLQQQGIQAENIEFEFVTYGQTDDAAILTAFRIPGMTEVAMEQLARMMSGAGAQEGVEAESVTIDGKSVLRLSVEQAGEAGVVYMYFTQGAAFTVVSQDTGSAEALIAELP